MPAITIRNLTEETYRALKARAAKHGRSTEAEVRSILEDATHPAEHIGLGTLLADIGHSAGGFDLPERDRAPHAPVDLSSAHGSTANPGREPGPGERQWPH